MKRILVVLMVIVLFSGCANKKMISYYENTKAGEKIESYQLYIRIFGTINNRVNIIKELSNIIK